MLKYLKNLTAEELLKFEKFINSPYFNSNRNIVKLFTYLKENMDLPGNETPVREETYYYVYQKIKYDDAKYRKLISDFSKFFEKFLMYQKFEEYSPGNRIMLLTSLRKRGLVKRFENNFEDISSLQKKSFSKDDDFYLNQIHLENEYYSFYFNRFQNEYAECLQNKSDNLNYYFVFCKLHNFLEMFNNEINKEIKSKFKKQFYDEIISFVEENRSEIQKNHPNLFIIYNVLQMYVTSDKIYLTELKEYLKENRKKFDKSSLSHYYNYLIAYYTIQINKGKIEYRTELFEIFEYMFKKDLFVIDNIITEQEYSTVINNTLALGEFDWVNKFIKKYKYRLDPAIASEAYNLAMAKLCFYKKDFNNIFTYLVEIKYSDSGYYINSKILLAKVYYDTGKTESVQYVLENLRQFLRRNKNLKSEQISIVKIFNKYVYTLLKTNGIVEVKKRKFEFAFLKNEIDNNKKLVPHKNWFYDKIIELS